MQMVSRREGYLEALKKNWLYPNVLSVPYDLETDAVAPNVKAFVEKNRQWMPSCFCHHTWPLQACWP